MASVENPAEGLRESIARVDGTGDVVEEDDTALLPLLKGEVLDVDVPRSLRWLLGVSHHDGGLIVAMHHRWSVLFDAELVQDRPKILDGLGCANAGNELGLGRARCDCGLPLGLVKYHGAVEDNREPGGGSSALKVRCMSGIVVHTELVGLLCKLTLIFSPKAHLFAHRLPWSRRGIFIGLFAPYCLIAAPADL